MSKLDDKFACECFLEFLKCAVKAEREAPESSSLHELVPMLCDHVRIVSEK